MPVPSYRVPVRVARGTLAALTAGVSDLQEGEICYATDENALYVIEGGVLTIAGSSVSGDLVGDTTPQLGGSLDVNGNEIVSLSNANIQIAPDGTGVLEVKGNTGNDAAIQLNCETNGHGVKIQSPPHSAAATYTLVLPDDTGTSGQALTTDGSGALSWATPSAASSLDDLSDVSYSAGSLEVDDLDQIVFSSADIPANVTAKLYANSTYGLSLGSYDTSTVDGSFLYAHDTKGIELRTNSEIIRLSGDSSGTANEPELRWESGNATEVSPTGSYIGLKLPANHSTDQTYVLPAADGTNGQVLTTDGSGTTSWTTASGGGGGGTLAGLSDVSTTDTATASVYSFDPLPGNTGGRVIVQPNSSSAYNFAGLSSWDNGSVSIVGGSGSLTRSTIHLHSNRKVFFSPDPEPNGVAPTNQTITIEVDGTDGQRVLYRTEPTLGTGTTDLVIPSMGQVRAYADASGGGANSIDDLTDVDTTTTAPTDGQVLVWSASDSEWVPGNQTVGGSGGSSAARLTEAQTAASGIATFTGIGHSGTLVDLTSSLDSWIVLYDSAASRTADSSRAYNTDPASGSGVLAEFYITAGSTVLATPGTTYFNNDTSVTEAVYAAVRDQAGSNVNSVVTITAYGNQTITSVSGGTFGSGI